MIENFQFQPTSELNSGANMEKMDSQEGMIGMGLTSTFHTILMQCSPQIFKVSVALKEVQNETNSENRHPVSPTPSFSCFFLEYQEYKMSVFGICFILQTVL